VPWRILTAVKFIPALHCAIQSGHQRSSDHTKTEMVKALIKLGADVNAQNAEGERSFHFFPLKVNEKSALS
jgi:hypothetical protein